MIGAGGPTEDLADAPATLRPDLRVSWSDADPSGGRRPLVELADRVYEVTPPVAELLAALAEHPRSFHALSAIMERNTGRTCSPSRLREIVQDTLPAAFFATTLPPRRAALRLKTTLLPERLVARLARRLTWCFDRRIVAIASAGFVAVALAMIGRSTRAIMAPASAAELAILYSAALGSVFVHELGHAAACLRYGCQPGRIGIGLYLVFPALFTDVTRAWRLPARHRAVVDLGGLYLQGILVIGLGAYCLVTSNPVASRLVWVTMFSMFYTLNPVFRMDGYWLLSDLSGLPNLHQRIGEGTRRLFGIPARGGSVCARPAPRRLVVVYLGLVLLHAVFIGQMAVRAFPRQILHYPAAVRSAAEFALAAWSRAALWDAGRGIVGIMTASFWPICYVYLAMRLTRAIAGLVRSNQATDTHPR